MATRKLSLAVIRRTVSALPDVAEGTSYGTPAWRHKGKLLARLHQDGRSIVLKVGNATRDHLLQADPETFFITDHYVGYPMVLAHLDRLSAADLKKLLLRAMETGARASGPHHERAGGPRSHDSRISQPRCAMLAVA